MPKITRSVFVPDKKCGTPISWEIVSPSIYREPMVKLGQFMTIFHQLTLEEPMVTLFG